MRQKIEAAKEQLNDVYHQLEQANETISLLSEKLEDVTADVETELTRIIGMLEGGHKHRDIDDAIADLKALIKEL